MKQPATVTACCSVSAYADPVSVTGIAGVAKLRIGEVARCSKCHKFKSDFRADKYPTNKEVSRLQQLMRGSSWSMAIDDQIKRPGSPLIFEVGTVCLVPVGYKGEVTAQPEFDEEPPF